MSVSFFPPTDEQENKKEGLKQATEEFKKAKIVDYIYDNLYYPDKSDIERKIDYILARSYKFPFQKNIYYHKDNNCFLVMSHELFLNCFPNKKPDFSSIHVYRLFYHLMEFHYRKNATEALAKRINHVFGFNFLNANQIFFRYEKTLLINGAIFDCPHHIILTKPVLKWLLKKLQIECYSDKDFNSAFQELHQNNNFHTFEKTRYNNYIISTSGQYIRRKEKALSSHSGFSIYDLRALNQFNFPIFPDSFQKPYIETLSNEEWIISLLLGEEVNNLIYVSKLTAAAYCYDMPLKVPTVIYSENTRTLGAMAEFLNHLFKNAVARPEGNELTSPESSLDSLAEKLFSDNVVILIDHQEQLSPYTGLKKLCKGIFLTNNELTIKNNLPVIILTTSLIKCSQLQNELNANVISVNKLDDFFFEKLNSADFSQIRLAFMLCGLSLYEHKNTDIKETETNTSYVEWFFWNFIEEDEGALTSKSELRNYFFRFLKKIYADKAIRSTAICDFLMRRGHNGRKKKRLSKHSNPVAVIEGIRFKEDCFEKYMNDSYHPDYHLSPKITKMLDWLKNPNVEFFM